MLGDNSTSQRIVSQSLKSAKRFSDVTRHIDDVTNVVEEEEEDDDDTAMREMLTTEYLEGMLYTWEANIPALKSKQIILGSWMLLSSEIQTKCLNF